MSTKRASSRMRPVAETSRIQLDDTGQDTVMSETRQMFGTDGIRGRANVHPMTPETALRVGMAVAAHFGGRGNVVIGKDTRLSGYMFETAVAAGLCAMGTGVRLVGPMPTPGIAYITSSVRADAGVVISASHNAFDDNGIKLFGADGFKLPDDVEAHLERLMDPGVLEHARATGERIAKAVRIDDAAGRYITHLKYAFPVGYKLDGMKIVVDCANGAAYRIAPAVLSELGAKVYRIACDPNGVNINDGCGALHPESMCARVREVGADLGMALDGDADRVVFCDADGTLVDGDAVLAMCARELLLGSKLKGGCVVATIMSNIGLERSLADIGIGLVRTPVGDRYVVEAMRAAGCNLGGESSGHLVFLDHATTGDGMIAALRVLTIMQRTGTPLSELASVMTRYPQRMVSIPVGRKQPLVQLTGLTRVIQQVENDLGPDGRVVVRYSGTEPKLRVMVEGPDEHRLAEYIERIGSVVRAELAVGA